MSINIFNPNKASCSSKVPGFSSVATKAGSLVDKVLKLFMAIILALVSAVKYSVGLVKSFKEEKPKTTIEKLAFADNSAASRIKKAVENQSTIIKIVIAAAAVTGAVYAYRSYNIETPTQPKGPGALVKALAIGALGIGALGIGALGIGALGIDKLIKYKREDLLFSSISTDLSGLNDQDWF